MLTIKFPLNFVEDAVTYLDHSPRAVRPHLTGALHFHVNTDTGRIKMIATNGHIAGLWCIDNAKPDSRANYTGSDFIANLIKLDPEGISDNDYKPVYEFNILVDKAFLQAFKTIKPLSKKAKDPACTMLSIDSKHKMIYIDNDIHRIIVKFNQCAEEKTHFSTIERVMIPNNGNAITPKPTAANPFPVSNDYDPIQPHELTFDLGYLSMLAGSISVIKNYIRGDVTEQTKHILPIEQAQLTGGVGRIYFNSEDYINLPAWGKSSQKPAKPFLTVTFLAVIMPIRLTDFLRIDTRADYKKFVEFFN